MEPGRPAESLGTAPPSGSISGLKWAIGVAGMVGLAGSMVGTMVFAVLPADPCLG